MLRNSKVLTGTYIPFAQWIGADKGDTPIVNNNCIRLKLANRITGEFIDTNLFEINKVWSHFSILNRNTMALAIDLVLDVNHNSIYLRDFINDALFCVLELDNYISNNSFLFLNGVGLNPYNLNITKLPKLIDNFRIYGTGYYYAVLSNGSKDVHISSASEYIDTSLTNNDVFNFLSPTWTVYGGKVFTSLMGRLNIEAAYITYLNFKANIVIHYMNDIFAMDNYEALKKNFRSRVLDIQTLPYYIN